MSTFIIKFLTGSDDLNEAIINEQTEEAAKLEFYRKHPNARILSINGKATSIKEGRNTRVFRNQLALKKYRTTN